MYGYNSRLFNGLTIDKIKKYLIEQIKYCENKFGKVLQRLKDDEVMLKENYTPLHIDIITTLDGQTSKKFIV